MSYFGRNSNKKLIIFVEFINHHFFRLKTRAYHHWQEGLFGFALKLSQILLRERIICLFVCINFGNVVVLVLAKSVRFLLFFCPVNNWIETFLKTSTQSKVKDSYPTRFEISANLISTRIKLIFAITCNKSRELGKFH